MADRIQIAASRRVHRRSKTCVPQHESDGGASCTRSVQFGPATAAGRTSSRTRRERRGPDLGERLDYGLAESGWSARRRCGRRPRTGRGGAGDGERLRSVELSQSTASRRPVVAGDRHRRDTGPRGTPGMLRAHPRARRRRGGGCAPQRRSPTHAAHVQDAVVGARWPDGAKPSVGTGRCRSSRAIPARGDR